MIIRTAKPSDLEALLELSAMLPPGMTSMPCDTQTWEKKLQLVSDSISRQPQEEQESVYLLVLEDPANNAIVGTAGIISGVGNTRSFYNYKMSKEVKTSPDINIKRSSNLLNLVNDYTGATELTSLFLMPEYRRNGAGQFLSRCRFVFMNDFPERFDDVVFAEIRGWLDENEESPFWNHLGQKFFKLPFHKADFISSVNGSQFISDLMPRFPVYLELLPQEAIEVIGRAHRDAAAAQHLLEKEGFSYNGAVDIFDAGPIVECDRGEIRSIQNTSTARIKSITDSVSDNCESPLCIVSNRNLSEYRLITSRIENPIEDEIAISAQDAKMLHVDVGSKIQMLQMRH
jgi:arginine N-succinyltransferase